jgi:hypothetical protein
MLDRNVLQRVKIIKYFDTLTSVVPLDQYRLAGFRKRRGLNSDEIEEWKRRTQHLFRGAGMSEAGKARYRYLLENMNESQRYIADNLFDYKAHFGYESPDFDSPSVNLALEFENADDPVDAAAKLMRRVRR